ncbi:MAG: hypothetical protein WA732_11240 [Pseudolabrys sp.]
MNFFQLMFGEWLELLFGFRGPINRTKYWLTFLIYFVALFALYILFGLFFSFPTDPVGIILTFATLSSFRVSPSPSSACTTATRAVGGCWCSICCRA